MEKAEDKLYEVLVSDESVTRIIPTFIIASDEETAVKRAVAHVNEYIADYYVKASQVTLMAVDSNPNRHPALLIQGS